MTIKAPAQTQIPQLRQLWKEAFGDTDAFLDGFFSTAFAAQRSMCIEKGGKIVAALYWLDGCCRGKKLAYLYAVATAKAMQGQGLCRQLMEATHATLKQAGYSGAVLVPGDEGLARMYEKMGYSTCTYVAEFSCAAAAPDAELRPIGQAEYAALRKAMLPEGAIHQEGINLTFLATFHSFWAGRDFLLAGRMEDGTFYAAELLGNTENAPGILAALGCAEGHFRAPGSTKPFGMYLPLEEAPAPSYLGFAFD